MEKKMKSTMRFRVYGFGLKVHKGHGLGGCRVLVGIHLHLFSPLCYSQALRCVPQIGSCVSSNLTRGDVCAGVRIKVIMRNIRKVPQTPNVDAPHRCFMEFAGGQQCKAQAR